MNICVSCGKELGLEEHNCIIDREDAIGRALSEKEREDAVMDKDETREEFEDLIFKQKEE